MKKLLLAIAIVLGGGIGYKTLKKEKKEEKEDIKLNQKHDRKYIDIVEEDYILKYVFRSDDIVFKITLFNDEYYDNPGEAVLELDKSSNFHDRIEDSTLFETDDTSFGSIDRPKCTLSFSYHDCFIRSAREIYAREYVDFLYNIEIINNELCRLYSDVDFESSLKYVDDDDSSLLEDYLN